jgi:uncharacterized iron-regulated membrane protein
MRRALVLLHRWLGLFTACFLFIAGLTGSIIAWDHELDAWLNPQLMHVDHRGPLLSFTELASKLEASDSRLRVSYLPLSVEPDHSLSIFVQPRMDAETGQPFELGFNEVFVDPTSGRVIGKREGGAVSLARENLLPFLYKLHYTLHLPLAGGYEIGVLLMGLIAIVWTLDAFVALYISFPSRKVWRKSFAFRFGQGSHKAAFDLHRSSGVWLWPVLLVFGFTAISMNLGDEVVRPLVGVFSPLQDDPFASPLAAEAEPGVSLARAVQLGKERAAERGIGAPVGGVFHASLFGVYGVGFFEPGLAHGDGGLGNPWVYLDARTGDVKSWLVPGEGSTGDLFMQAQFPLHSGRIVGVTGRVFVTVLGLLIALLSFTGVWLWAKKRIARAQAAAR